MVPNLSAKALKQSNFGVVCVCRAPESDLLRSSVRNEWKNCLWIAEDTAIIDASIEKVCIMAYRYLSIMILKAMM